MKFKKVKLSSTNFFELASDASLEETRFPPKDGEKALDWYCAYDESREIIFTQLISSTSEMRDFNYYYLLFIKADPIFIHYSGNATFQNKGALSKYTQSELIKISNEAAVICTANNQPIFIA